MDDDRLPFPACVIAGKARIDAEDVCLLRRCKPYGVTDMTDARTLVLLHWQCPMRCVEWDDYLADQISGFVVEICHPHGRIDDDNARSLIMLIAPHGRIGSRAELDILMRALERAKAAPEALTMLALDQLALDLLEGCGPLRGTDTPNGRAIGIDDLAFLHRVLSTNLAHGETRLPEAQRQWLLRLDGENAHTRHHPGWYGLIAALRRSGDGADMPAPTPSSAPGERWLKVGDRFLLGSVQAA